MAAAQTEDQDELKISLESFKTICRCCLCRDKHMNNIESYSVLFQDLTGIQILQSDGVPPWICVECSYLLEKSVRFKHKLMKAHSILYEYLTRCAPFPIDAQDPELGKYATPHLSQTEVWTCDNGGRARHGFHTVEKHRKLMIKTELSVEDPCAVAVKREGAPGSVKDEVDAGHSDFDDDDIPLDEYRSQIEKVEQFTEEELKELLEDSKSIQVEPRVESRKRKKIKKSDKVRKKRRTEVDLEVEESKTSVRKSIEIDPAKITHIKLNYEEQLKLREEMSRDEKYVKLPFKCELCFKGFNHENKLDNHMKKHSPSRGKFECKLCSMYLPTIYSFNIHELTHTTRYECNRCGRRMVDRASIVEHYSAVHEGLVKRYACHLCGKVSHNNKTHRGHMRNHHGGERPKCDQCGKTFVNKDSLNDHMLIHRGIKNHECEVCGQRFRTKTQVTHHQLKHSDVRDHYCVECDVRFKSEHNLRQHLYKSLRHRDRATMRFPCPRCDLRLATARALAHHLTYQHDGRRVHSCPHCAATLATPNSLAKHVRCAHRGHREPLRHVCDACGKAFRSKSTLTNHVRTHTGEKPFECDQCGRKFSQRTAMRTHVKLVHLRIKREAKIKNIQVMPPSDKMEAKEEAPTVFDNWNRTSLPSDIYFTVTSGP